MALGATTYTSVTWTTGDVITEAKLDNMVANDQAYDSHAAQGILLNNNVGYFQKDSGGTNRAVANIGADDILRIGPLTREDDTSKTTVYSNMIQTGWGQIAGDNTADVSEAVTFPDTFTTVPIIVATYIGGLAGGGATSPDDFVTGTASGSNLTSITISNSTTSGFTVYITRYSDTLSAANTYGYSWIAIGSLT